MARWWRAHPRAYEAALRAMRDSRLRTLALLTELVKRQRPLVKAVEKVGVPLCERTRTLEHRQSETVVQSA
jgi:hypothetical protein